MSYQPVFDRLVPAGDAWELIYKEHQRRSSSKDLFQCKQFALETILTRLCEHQLDAWSGSTKIDSTLDTVEPEPGEVASVFDFYVNSGKLEKVPVEFWWHFRAAVDQSRNFDPVGGDFTFAYSDSEYAWRTGSSFSVHFDVKGLPRLTEANWQPVLPEKDGNPVAKPETLKVKDPGGRSPAEWWPQFCEELAFQIHENGVPKTQEALIRQVFGGMTARGLEEPGRSTVQPAISALFRRLEAARKSDQ